MKRSKAYVAAATQVDEDAVLEPVDAIALAQRTSTTKFAGTVEIAIRLGVDPRKADQMVRAPSICRMAPERPRASSCLLPVTARSRHGPRVPTLSAPTN